MKLSAAVFLVLLSSPSSIDANQHITPISADEQEDVRLRRDNECPDGFQGANCARNINECQALPYPCASGEKLGSFCVDYDPPKKFKCGCLPGYEAILPSLSDVKDNVTVEWRPVKCLPKDVCVGFDCHEDASCAVSSNNTAVCLCNDDLIGDGITSCSPKPTTVIAKPSSLQSPPCKTDSECNKIENSACVEGACICRSGFYKSNGKGQCINENECADSYPNDCHKNAICKDTEGSYICTCMDGYRDRNPNDKPGTICMQINECLDPSMNDCNDATQVCLDLPPPSKWQCIERTPAPTPAPTASCYNDQAGISPPDTGCTRANPFCAAGTGKGGNRCGECIDNETGNNVDSGCEVFDVYYPYCATNSEGYNTCGECIDDKTGNIVDSGCEVFDGYPYCATNSYGFNSCGECIDDKTGLATDSGCEQYVASPICVTNSFGYTSCGNCIDDKAGDDPTNPDFGCSGEEPFCRESFSFPFYYSCSS